MAVVGTRGGHLGYHELLGRKHRKMNPAVEFQAVNDQLHLLYAPRDDSTWVLQRFERGEDLVIKRTFHLTKSHLVETEAQDDEEISFDDAPLRFRVASKIGDYFVFDEDVLLVGCPVKLSCAANPTWKWFTAEQKTSILNIIAELQPSQIVLGGPEPDAIPLPEYEALIEQFPTSLELRRYVRARVAGVVREYSDAKVDAEAALRKYVGKRLKRKPKDLRAPFLDLEVMKYQHLLAQLRTMLGSEEAYTESAWQSEILKIVQLLNPKYIGAFEHVPIKDFESNTDRQLDILLVDASGNIDLIEIKQPFDKCIVTSGVYRDNHIPLRELSGSIMQIEKYIFHLNRWGQSGEMALTERFKDRLPSDFKIKITNPCGIVIMGRSNNLSEAQRRDFEVIRRKYKNVVDIITYDDLLSRLEVVISQLNREIGTNTG